MNLQVFMALSLLNDLKAAAVDAIEERHKGPALLLLYSFIDICASLANADPRAKLGDRFREYVQKYSLCKWTEFTPHDLWAARSSLLHAYSPFGDHTKRADGARPIFYYAWPEKRHEVEEILSSRKHTNFLVVDVDTILSIATSAYNGLIIATEQDPAVEHTVASNAVNLLRMSEDVRLEQAMETLRSVGKAT